MPSSKRSSAAGRLGKGMRTRRRSAAENSSRKRRSSRYNYVMTTLTPAKARTNLSGLLRKALRGADIGIVVDGRVVALRPVQVVAADYVESEYGLAPAQWRQSAVKLHEKAQRNIKAGKARRFKGSI